MNFYDRLGKEITLEQWARLHSMPDYCRVALTEVAGFSVSTVWLGTDHSYGGPNPVIFETIVFDADGKGARQQRYSTQDQAIEGHEKTVSDVMMEGFCG